MRKAVLLSVIALFTLAGCSENKPAQPPLPDGVEKAPSYTAEVFDPMLKAGYDLILAGEDKMSTATTTENWNSLQLLRLDKDGTVNKNGRYEMYYNYSVYPGGFCLSDLENKVSFYVNYTSVSEKAKRLTFFPYDVTRCVFYGTKGSLKPGIEFDDVSSELNNTAEKSPNREVYERFAQVLQKSEMAASLRSGNIVK